jgi:hypothetical protein
VPKTKPNFQNHHRRRISNKKQKQHKQQKTKTETRIETEHKTEQKKQIGRPRRKTNKRPETVGTPRNRTTDAPPPPQLALQEQNGIEKKEKTRKEKTEPETHRKGTPAPIRSTVVRRVSCILVAPPPSSLHSESKWVWICGRK